MKTTVVVTGASAGIGRALAREFASAGYDLLLVARSESALEELAGDLSEEFGIAASAISMDLATPGAARRLFDAVQEMDLEIDYLVNNAGFGQLGAFTETDLEMQINMIQLNVTALTELSWLFLQPMIERGRGGLLNVASTAAFQPGPLMAVYYATKAYVLSFTDALANELAESGVTVTTLCPGPTKTEFQDRADMEDSPLMKSFFVMSSESVAKAGFDGLMEGERRVVPGVMNKLGAFSTRLAPRNLLAAITRKAQEPPS